MEVIAVNNAQRWLIGISFVAALAMSNAGIAQDGPTVPNREERIARARWQPSRRVAMQEQVPQPIPESGSPTPVPHYDSYPMHSPAPSMHGHVMDSGHMPMNENCSCSACRGAGACDTGSCDTLGCDALACDAMGDCGDGCFGHGGRLPRAGLFVPLPVNWWVHGEYLMWWPRPMNIPPLVTSGTNTSEGVLGQAGTQTLVGGQMLDQMFSGGRLRVGFWTDRCKGNAWEFEIFGIGQETDTRTFTGTGAAGTNVLARPFFNVLTSATSPNGQEDSELVSFAGELRGTVSVEATSQLYGAGVHWMQTYCQSCGCGRSLLTCQCTQVRRQISAFAGWRYLNFEESLRINENLTSLLPAPDNGNFLIEDRFETRNRFHGADLGVVWKGRRGRLSSDMLMRLAIGTNHQNVSIRGATTISGSDAGNNVTNATGGLLAQRTNIGDYSRDRFAVVPELGLTLGYQIAPQWRATVGYTFLYWSSVVRPGDQIDRDVNPNLLPPETVPFTGLERPAFRWVESDLWVNGLNLGLERTW